MFKFKIFWALLTLIPLIHQSSYSSQRWTAPINLQNLNSEYDEFAPFWDKWNEILYFNSTRNGYSQFFISARIDSINFTNPKIIQDKLNKKNSNRSYITMNSPEEAIISSFKLYERRSYLNLHRVYRTGNNWGEPILDDSLKCECFVSHPTISPDGKILIFSSDRFSENGDTDLWMAVRQDDGTWGAILNLSEINSPGNEITPFLASNDTLYFATDGQIGPGGFDIFYSVLIDGIWQRPKPLIGINTEYNESDPIILPNGDLIFASDRTGGKGVLDLYLSKPIIDDSPTKIPQKPVIETFISSIQMKVEVQHESFPIVPLFWADNVSTEGNLVYSGMGLKNSKGIVSADSIYAASLGLIAERLSYVKDAILYINPQNFQFPWSIDEFKNKSNDLDVKIGDLNYQLNLNTIGDLQEFFIKRFSIDSSQISISDNIPREVPVFYLYSNKPEIFKPLEVKWERAEFQPPFIELLINAETENLLSCQCLFKIGNDTLLVHSDVKTFEKLRIDIDNYLNYLINLDILKIIISCRYKNNIITSQDFEIPVIKSKIEGRKIYKNDRQFTRYFFILNDIDDIDRFPHYKAELEDIIKSAAYSKKIRIIYFDAGNPKSKTNSELLAKKLKDSLKSNAIIEINALKESQILEISSNLKPFVIQILLER